MLRTSNVKRILSIFLVISLICSNFSPMILGLVSFALEENEEENAQETISSLEIETVEFSKNNMLEEETEYDEKVKLNLNYEEPFTEVVISDVSTRITDGVIQEETELEEVEPEEEEQEETNIFYKATKINKEELISIIGKTGKLVIEYEELEEEEVEEHSQIIAVPENEEEELPEDEEEEVIEEEETVEVEEETSNESEEEILEEEIEIELEEEIIEEEPKGIITAEDGIVTITAETEADEEGNITIIYPERTNSINIKISTEINKIEDLTIINRRKVEKVEDLDKVAELETVKDIIVKAEKKEKKETIEIELLNAEATAKMPISYSKTLAELGLDKTQISTSIENKVTLTITLNTEKAIYDLYKNPYFVIELPSEIKTLNIDKAVIINNEVFEPEAIEQGILANGNNAIAIKLNGEQLEHTSSIEANIQMLLELTLVTEELIPTLDREVILHYTNENANTYNGIELEEEGTSIVPIELVSNSEVIAETRATVGDTTTIALRDNSKEINIEPNTYNRVAIEGTAINNTGANIANARILVSATNISEISGVETVYYTENAEATAELNNAENFWTREYTSNVQKALIVIPEYEQGQTVRFGYIMNLPTNPEMELQHVAQFEVYDSNNQNIKTSKITVNQEVQRFDIFENDEIRAEIYLEDDSPVKVGEEAEYKVKITNKTDKDIDNVTLQLYKPTVVDRVSYFAEKDTTNVTRAIDSEDVRVSVDGSDINENSVTPIYNKIKISDIGYAKYSGKDNKFNINKLTLPANETTTMVVKAEVTEYKNSTEKVNVAINYNNVEEQIYTRIRYIEPTTVLMEMRSNKEGQILEANESIEYKMIIKNDEKTDYTVNFELLGRDSLNVQRMEAINTVTGETISYAATDLKAILSELSLKPGETIEIHIEAQAKELKKDTISSVYAKISGNGIAETNTNILTNVINKKVEEIEELPQEIENNINTNEVSEDNTIKGIAWIDRNENGRQDGKEILLKNVEVKLINTETSEVIATQRTNKSGEYEFTDLPTGKYVVEFNYNSTTFNTTEYKNETVESELDSDIVSTTQGNKTTSKTEVITLKNGKVEDVNAGFVMNKKFDLNVNTGITKLTVDSENGTNTYEYNSESKVEAKITNNSLLIVEYEVAVTNTGEVAGYAKLISNTVPEGMTFNSELNTNWYEGNDGKVYSVALADKELQPGETAIIKLILTKEIVNETELSLISSTNIEKTFNEYLIEDKSIENNLAETTLAITTKGRRK